jgi:hypothetical protein
MDLRLDNTASAKLHRGGSHFPRCGGHFSRRNWNPVALEKILGLILMDIHGS